ncbi:MAG: virulence factor SrfC family protein [Prevotella sp.]|uniref:virulence factor SrfC family protein n=1 Tax=Prevotella sp. TaxID=59823 RepID=UPI002A2711DB|nr:virulence factor SrfC family protein [Prevotella sp.]MDD7319101.1 virulence factor SrfC family protein [Prevotellaceae bacterium]MDY4019624.1 virulence factor SrfC family protein [Prevotella sp.]
MIQRILSQITNINESLAWIKKYRPDDYEQKFLQLVENRRMLKRIAAASEHNPGIAAFGKSQVGKSYLISCLLQDNGKPFMVKAGGKSYNFVYKINPPSVEGGGIESTGVVTRFSSFKRQGSIYNRELPVLISTFSVADIITILSDSYYNDFGDYSIMSENEIKELCENWENTYGSREVLSNPIITADDIINLKFYFVKHINNAQTFNKSSIFDRLALLIEKIPQDDYAEVFSNLWNRHNILTTLFNKLFSTLRVFGFSKRIYLPINSVLHEGVREDTIMSVQCLKQLFHENSANYTTDVYINKGGEYVKCASGMPKSEICAICSEVVFKIDDEFLSSERPYEWESMDDDVKTRISHAPVKMEMLKDNDLLDFPGARAREQEALSKLNSGNVLDFFLRGKVAYLFNRYNENMDINILLYCHHNKDNDVTNLYKMLEDWVCNYVGDSAESRRKKLELTKRSPLFYIGTMFNIDMELGKGGEVSEKAIEQRWIGRFETVVNRQCFHRGTVDWVRNWTREGENFKNSYVLRDYKFSENLYDGFEETGSEQSSKMSATYYEMMRKTFIGNEHVKSLFADPAMSWDVAATRNNDGALHIIEHLSDVTERMDVARESDFNNILENVCSNVMKIMKDYHISENVDELLEANIRKAKAIFREMDFTCNNDNYYFGHLIQRLQMTETASYRIIHNIMQSPEINGQVNDFKDYEIIRNSCKNNGHPLESANSDTEKWQCIIETYGFISRDEAADFLKRKNIVTERLFSGEYKRKINSCIIADNVYEKWIASIKSVDFMKTFTDDMNFDGVIMGNLIDNIISTSRLRNLPDIMAEVIAQYVNVVNIHTANESLLADMLASKINDFVLDFGFRYIPEQDIEKAKKLCEKRHLQAFNYVLREEVVVSKEEDLTCMFNEMSTNPKSILHSFDDNYNKWIEFMFISFIVNLEIPDFDHDANMALSEILDKIREPK